jgi:hypothetical protein
MVVKSMVYLAREHGGNWLCKAFCVTGFVATLVAMLHAKDVSCVLEALCLFALLLQVPNGRQITVAIRDCSTAGKLKQLISSRLTA